MKLRKCNSLKILLSFRDVTINELVMSKFLTASVHRPSSLFSVSGHVGSDVY